MLNHDNRVVEFPRRFQLVPVPGTSDVFDLVPVPGTIRNPGGKSNYALFESIKDDINDRLAVSAKATQAQAEEGTDNTNYMTVLRVKDYHRKNIGIKTTRIDLNTSGTTTIDLTQYMTEKTQKIDILFDISFDAPNRAIELNASSIRVNYAGEIGSWDQSRYLLGNGSVNSAIGKLELYITSCDNNSNSGIYIFTGVFNGSTRKPYTEQVSIETGQFNTLSSIILGHIDSVPMRPPVFLYQYLK